MRRLPLILALSSLLVAAVPAAASAKVATGPSGAAFYKPPKKLPGSHHGDPIWARKLTGGAVLTSASVNQLVLYRSTDARGKTVAVSGTVALPKGKAPKGGWPVITYAHGTTGIADSCAPSLDNGKNAAHAYSAYSYPLMNSWLKRGYAVVRTDYQGLGTPGTHEYLGGVSEGHSTLDIVLASRRLDKGLSRRFVIAGHSQGGHAALWAAAQAARWTPSLTLRGTVAFAPASHLSEQVGSVRAITTPSGITGLLAMIVRGLDTTTPSSGVRGDLSGPAAALYPQTLTKCLVELSRSDSFGGIAPSDLFRSDADVDPVVKALDKSDPENLKITTPLLVAQGGKDTTVFPALTDQLVQQYRDGGTKVDYRQYPDADHVGAVLQGAGDATKWIDGRLR